MNTVCIILAKGHSNRIHQKNKQPFCGRPLYEWSILQSINSHEIQETYVSTDDDEIAANAAKYCKVIRRPYELTLTPANQAVVHAMDEIERERGKLDETVVLLPTSPVRLPWDIDNMIHFHRLMESEITATVCYRLENIVYEQLPNSKMHLKLWDKQGRYFTDGGGMSVQDPTFYRKFSEGLPDRDAVLDAQIEDEGGLDEFMYIMKEWQTPELDIPDHWLEAEAIMEAYILRRYGRDCYEKYNEYQIWEE